VGLLAACLAVACGTASPTVDSRATGSPSTGPSASATIPDTMSPTPSPTPTATPSCAELTLASLTLEQRAGQLVLMGVGGDSLSAAEAAAIRNYHLGSVYLVHRRYNGVAATAALTSQVQALATGPNTGGIRFFVAEDQEGGRIQHLKGEGFSTIPSALVQGTYSLSQLETLAAQWGGELAQAGINLNFAPVMDVVPPGIGSANKPIGAMRREFGHDPDTVGSHGAAFIRGMGQAGIATTLKHFPGLGRVTGNTDKVAGVTDSVTTAQDPYLEAFRAGIEAGAPFVMISLASYPAIDPHQPAIFSSIVMEDVLRGRLGFKGVIISDDLGGTAAVASMPAGQRAVGFISAGGEMVVVQSPAAATAMAKALVSTAGADAAFKARLDAAALHVLQTKEARGLLPCH
jgi:beta-N-acetylhexosaminidase